MEAAIAEVVTSFVYGAIVNVLAFGGLIPQSFILLFGLINAGLTAGLILSVPRWGLWFSIGWIVAVLVMINSNLLSLVDILIYLGTPIGFWGIRIWLWRRDG